MSETSPSSSPYPQSSDSLDALLRLASQRLDGDLADLADSECTPSAELYLAELLLFEKQAAAISRSLKSVEVTRVSGLLFDAQLMSQPAVVSVLQTPASLSPRRQFAGVVSMLVMAACLVVAVLSPPFENSDFPQVTANWNVRKAAELAMAELPSSDSWNVVVVNMRDHNRSRAMQQVQSVVRSHGFEFARSAGKEMPEWLGVVLSASESESQALINDIRNTVAGGAIEHDPLRVAESSREELITAVRESLRYPTQSELHHGKVYLAMPEFNRLTSEDAALAKMEAESLRSMTPENPDTAMAGADKEVFSEAIVADQQTGSSDYPNHSSKARASSLDRTETTEVVLVVFQFDVEPVPELKI